MEIGTFTIILSARKFKTTLIKTYRNVLKPSNPTYTIPIAHEQTLQKCGFPCTLQAVLGSHSIVVKCTAAIFFSYGGLPTA